MPKIIGVMYNSGDTSYEFRSEDGQWDIPVSPEMAKGVQYNYRIWFDPVTGDWGRMEEVAGSELLERKHVLLLRTCYNHTTDEEFEELREETKRVGREAERFYQYYCGDIWDVKVHADVVKYEYAPWNNNWNAKMFTDYKNRYDIFPQEEFDPRSFNYFHCWSHYHNPQYCGLGQLWNKYSWTQVTCGLHTIIHELGHNFGLHHANREGKEYGDKTCVMGSGKNVPGLNAVNVSKLRKEARRKYAFVENSQELYLAPLETKDHCLFPEEHVLAEVSHRGSVWLSIRRHAGAVYDFNVPEADKLHVHTKVTGGKTLRHETISPGDTTRLPNGVICTYVEFDGRRARIALLYGEAQDIGRKVEFPQFPLEPTPYKPWMDGLWYNPKYDGQGLSINDGMMTWYGFQPGEVHHDTYDHLVKEIDERNSCFHVLDRNNAILLIDDPYTGRDAIELKRLTLPSAESFIDENDGWVLDWQGEAGLLDFGEEWAYLQNGKVYYSTEGRWMQQSALALEEVGTYVFEGTEFTITLNGERHTWSIK